MDRSHSAAYAADDAGDVGALDVLAHELHRLIAGSDVHAGSGVGCGE